MVVVVMVMMMMIIILLNCLKHVSSFLSHHLLGDDVGLLRR